MSWTPNLPQCHVCLCLVLQLWDWDVGASWDDGATWAGWKPTEKSPGSCGEGGGGQGMGASGKVIMFHHNHWWSSLDGGHNFLRGDLPGVAGGFDYIRQPGSRSEPAGTCFALMDAPPPGGGDDGDDDDDDRKDGDRDDEEEEGDDDDKEQEGYNYHPDAAEGGEDDDEDDEDETDELDPDFVGYHYRPGLQVGERGTVKYLMVSHDFGQNWSWSPLPASLQAGAIAVDPTSASSLFVVTANCLAHSTDQGASWSNCSAATGLAGQFSKLLVKDSKTMFMLRSGAVPLRTVDGGLSWAELSSAAPLFKYGATMDGSLSWSGNTLVLSGVDLGAIAREEYGTAVWKSSNDGDDWADETADLVTISPGPGVWYEKDFCAPLPIRMVHCVRTLNCICSVVRLRLLIDRLCIHCRTTDFVTRGEGVTVKRAFEA